MMDALQRAVADACLGARSGEKLVEDARGFLAVRGVADEDIDSILAAPPRLALYRSLVRNGLSAVVERMLPRTRARLNAAQAARFDADLAAFLDQVGPRTHYLRDVPAEFFSWAEPRWRGDTRVPAYLPDLAAYELMHFAIAASESARGAHPIGDITLDRPLSFVESTRIARFNWAVHELSRDETCSDEPLRREVCLLAYRDAAHTVRWLDLTPLAASLLEHLLEKKALGVAVQLACERHQTAPASVLPDIARLLADLGERGIISGAEIAE